MNPSYVYDHVRTPIGRYGGALAEARPDDLAALVVKEIAARSDKLDPAQIDDVFLGDVNGAGEDNRDVARMATLLAGFPTSVTGVTVNRLCGSGMEAAIEAARAVETGDASITIAGGVESMTRSPWVLLKPKRPYPPGHETLHSTTLGWRMVNPAMPAQWSVSLGEATEVLIDRYDVSREDADEYAARSHRLADQAWNNGLYDPNVVPVPGVDLRRDESIRPDTTAEKLAQLKPAFREDGRVTAGNSSPLNDGAAALIIGDEAAGEVLGADPLARIVSRAVHGVDPNVFGIAPVEAANKALAKAGIGWEDIKAVELNEAFAAQALACVRSWEGLDPELVNANGGAIAIGHPLGCSGARILGALASDLNRRGGGYGLAALCIGVGQALAVVLEG